MKQLTAILLIGVVAAASAASLILLKPEAEKKAVIQPITEVTAVQVRPGAIQLSLRSQGTVLPITETDISVQVSGRIVEIAKNFREGCFVEKGETLLRIEKEDYEAVFALTEADLAKARLALATEKALAKQAAEDWKAMGSGEASSLTLRKPQLAMAEAQVKSALAALEKARRDLQRTVVSAPYDAYILQRKVDLGQYVNATPATPVARIFQTAKAEIRLPLTIEDALLLENPADHEIKVTLYRDTPQGRVEWTAQLARMEATIDPANRLIHAIAEMDHPFRETNQNGKLPLQRGLFVEAEIQGRTVQDVYSLPRYALRGSQSVYIVTPENTLIRRTVEILKSDTEHVVIGKGLRPGEQVVTSPIAYFSEQMPVQVIKNP
ncbi:MAG: efflux RND transporter periplasmic adaptor subunit [Coraliomargaritaceae bacterium]